MACVYSTSLPNQRQAWGPCDTWSSEYISYWVGVNKFLCGQKGSSSTFLNVHQKYIPAKITHTHKSIARLHRCPHRCCGMPLHLNKINDRHDLMCVYVWNVEHSTPNVTFAPTYMKTFPYTNKNSSTLQQVWKVRPKPKTIENWARRIFFSTWILHKSCSALNIAPCCQILLCYKRLARKRIKDDLHVVMYAEQVGALADLGHLLRPFRYCVRCSLHECGVYPI